MARGSPAIPCTCKGSIDKEYQAAGALYSLHLPLYPRERCRSCLPHLRVCIFADLVFRPSCLTIPRARSDARWASPEAALALYRNLGPDYVSPYCDDGCHVDHHPSILGMYLNALVFYATLFKRSPIGAAWPDGKIEVDGMVLPAINSAADARAMQRIAHDVVLPHMDVWWNQQKW